MPKRSSRDSTLAWIKSRRGWDRPKQRKKVWVAELEKPWEKLTSAGAAGKCASAWGKQAIMVRTTGKKENKPEDSYIQGQGGGGGGENGGPNVGWQWVGVSELPGGSSATNEDKNLDTWRGGSLDSVGWGGGGMGYHYWEISPSKGSNKMNLRKRADTNEPYTYSTGVNGASVCSSSYHLGEFSSMGTEPQKQA